MNHEELSGLYELYTLGVLEDPERAEIETHLSSHCAHCQTQVRRALSLNAVFATLPEQVDPPRRLRGRVLASVGAEPAANRFWKNAWVLATAAFAMGLVIVAIDGHRRGQELAEVRDQMRQSSTELVEARKQVQRSTADLKRMQAALTLLELPTTRQVVFGVNGAQQPPRGRIFVNRQEGVMLLASNLPALPSGRTYELWFMPKGGAPIPAGLFQSDSTGHALYVRNGPVTAGIAAMAVSVEPEAGSQAPTTTPVFVAAVAD